MPRVSVIIVNFNAGDWLTRSVASVAAQTMADFECFIIDNGSVDNSMTSLPDLDNRFKIIELGENTGFARANNIGAHKANSDWIALLNPDAFARPDWLDRLLLETTRRDDITMVGSRQIMALDSTVLDGLGDCYSAFGIAYRAGYGHNVNLKPETGFVFGPCAAAALYHRETFLRLGGFDKRFFCYHEDVDLALRMRLAGGECVQSADAIVDHVSSAISNNISGFAVFHGTRNRVWTFFKSMPLPLLILLSPLHIFANLAYLLWATFRPGRLKPTARGLWYALIGLPGILATRKDIMAHKTISSTELLSALTFSPLKVVRRGVHIRPLSDKERE
ncbi:glycosyltransferase family 2 protein [Robiginitomaculum antarcticum]|uniref:glycosyltransferase family 2 protein n=1 Tax=Robiginitomaculum antarcticum TaxID=437507 RepID=UPI00036733C1|nr:glycosyltransferase family 2 protein [Robiginitomaculum antarcticum]